MGPHLIYADSNIIIRLIEGDALARLSLEGRLNALRGTGRFLLTSQLSRLECRTKPLRTADNQLLALYDFFFASLEVTVLPLSVSVVDKATALRAELQIKTPDALHLASAILWGATAFLTGDKELQKCKELPIELF